MIDPFSPALLARAGAAPEVAGIIALGLALSLTCLGPLPHAARALLRLTLPAGGGMRARQLGGAARLGLRAGVLAGIALGGTVAGGPGALVAAVTAAALLLVLCDLRWRWLPMEWTLALASSGLLLALVTGEIAAALVAGIALALPLAGLALAYRQLRGMDGLGMGDVLLSAAIAIHLGLLSGTIVLATAALAALAAEILLRRDRSATPGAPRGAPLGAWLAFCFACAAPASMII